jgi:twitching motility two-component system response regulator PilH
MTMKKILVVDDSPTHCAHVSGLLERQGYEVLVASSGEAGIERCRTEQPQLILMDVVMPGLDGFQATRTLARDDKTRHIPIVICSNKSQETDRIWGMRQGAKSYLTKPLQEGELLGKVAALLAR